MVDPQGVQLHSFGVPTEKERSQHYLQRIREALPAGGRIGVFDRSHYEDVLVVRVNELVPREVWEPRYDEINAFEQEVVDAGTVIVKVVLHRLAGGAEGPAARAAGAPGQVLEVQPERRRRAREVAARTRRRTRPSWTARAPSTRPGTRARGQQVVRAAGRRRLLRDALEGLHLGWPPADFDVEAEKARLDAQPLLSSPDGDDFGPRRCSGTMVRWSAVHRRQSRVRTRRHPPKEKFCEG